MISGYVTCPACKGTGVFICVVCKGHCCDRCEPLYSGYDVCPVCLGMRLYGDGPRYRIFSDMSPHDRVIDAGKAKWETYATVISVTKQT